VITHATLLQILKVDWVKAIISQRGKHRICEVLPLFALN